MRFITAAAGVGVAVVVLIALEGVARIVWEGKRHDRLEATLHGYEHVDYRRNLVVPTAGARVTVAELRSDLRARGRHWGLAHLDELQRKYSLSDTSVLISINDLGFRGPDVATPKPKGVFRILSIGDSCTWGLSVGGGHAYPRVLERALNEAIDGRGDLSVDVVNGGFCGDGLELSLARIDEFARVEPDLITIYQGWNRTIFRADHRKLGSLYRLSALYRLYYHTVVRPPGRGHGRSGEHRLVYDPRDPLLEPFRDYTFEHDVSDLDRLVRALRDRRPSATIVLITLAGLLDCDVQPDARALEMSFPLNQLENVYLFPLLTQRWNSAIRSYARTEGLDVIELDEYARTGLDCRSDYFLDNVHWNTEGYRKVGEFLAGELVRYVPFEQSKSRGVVEDDTLVSGGVVS
jgi:lysophospholipase L1-like esterase